MSPAKVVHPPPPRVSAITTRLASDLGRDVRAERLRRGWTLERLAERAGVSLSAIHAVESGRVASLEMYARLALALGLEPSFDLRRDRIRRAVPDADPVHAAMGEVEAAHLSALGFEVLLDEPYQHYQFAGRADLIAIDRSSAALLHLENRTRFPDIQAFAGAYNAKRSYLADAVAKRTGLVDGFRVVDHVVVALWSSEVLHTLRLRGASFRAICGDSPDGFAGWWTGTIEGPMQGGSTSSIVIFDPLTGQRSSRRRWVGLDDVRTVDPRYRGYADALTSLRGVGLA